ncbi:MAG: VanZ family protein [Comamonadaceae bacterium]|nr:VanZ family protein [Comamonadaceae bacterium]
MTQTPKASAWSWWLLTLTYYLTVCLAHLQFSIWLVRQRDTVFGRMAFAELMPAVAVVVGLALLGAVVLQLRRSPRPGLTGGFWLLWLGSVALVDRYLTFSINEYAHYPQYALLAWLVARALDPQRQRWMVGQVLFWTTLMGMGDELLQYLWITSSYSDYLDFNDFLTNLVAAAAGMLLYYGAFTPQPGSAEPGQPWVMWCVVGVLTLTVAVGLQTGRLAVTTTENIPPGGIVQLADGTRRLYLQRAPTFYGSTQNGPRHGQYHVLSPLPGLLIMLGVGLVFAGYGRCWHPATADLPAEL